MSSFGDLIWRQRSARKAGSSSRQFVYSFSDAADEAARLVFGKAKWVRLAKNIRYEVDITTYVNGPLMNPVQLDTTTVATDTISYVATDQGGLTWTTTRTVIIQAPSIVPSAAASTTQETLQINNPAEAFLFSLAVFVCSPRCDNGVPTLEQYIKHMSGKRIVDSAPEQNTGDAPYLGIGRPTMHEDVWNTTYFHRAIQKRIGETLSAGYDLSTPLPDRIRILLRQLDEPNADGLNRERHFPTAE